MTNPSSIEHVVSILYTIGGYSNKDLLTPESVKMIPRVEEFTEVNLITDNEDITNDNNYFNYNSGQLVINKLEQIRFG